MDTQDTIGQPQRGKSQALAYTGTSAQSASISGGTTDTICIQSTTDCFIEIGINPTATANTSHFIGAYQPTYLRITPSDPGPKVAAIQLANAGTLYITPF